MEAKWVGEFKRIKGRFQIEKKKVGSLLGNGDQRNLEEEGDGKLTLHGHLLSATPRLVHLQFFKELG